MQGEIKIEGAIDADIDRLIANDRSPNQSVSSRKLLKVNSVSSRVAHDYEKEANPVLIQGGVKFQSRCLLK